MKENTTGRSSPRPHTWKAAVLGSEMELFEAGDTQTRGAGQRGTEAPALTLGMANRDVVQKSGTRMGDSANCAEQLGYLNKTEFTLTSRHKRHNNKTHPNALKKLT